MTTDWHGLCVRQPWADAFLDPSPDGKRVENRKGSAVGWKYRGPLVVIAPKFWAATPDIFADPRLCALWPSADSNSRGYALRHRPPARQHPPHPFVASAALGIVDLVDIHPASGCCAPWGEDSYTEAGDTAVTQVAHLVTEDPRRFDRPIRNVSGFLGIRRLDEELAAEVDGEVRWSAFLDRS